MSKSVGGNDNLQEKVWIHIKMSDCNFVHQNPTGSDVGAPQGHKTNN
jgi:hypothetical protein